MERIDPVSYVAKFIGQKGGYAVMGSLQVQKRFVGPVRESATVNETWDVQQAAITSWQSYTNEAGKSLLRPNLRSSANFLLHSILAFSP